MRTLLSAALCYCLVAVAHGQEIRFRPHLLNADSEFSAAAVLDVDGDGAMDIASGEYWYAAPDWKPRRFRQIEKIRGRFDDYSNLPLDVNGDGRTDLVSVNYRSNSLYWVENPGDAKKLWKNHVIDKPGPSETGRLADIDGDGRLDVLPAGTRFSAWYSVAADDEQRATWTRHDLPDEVIGHGLGFGDVDGDGRGDIVGVAGFLSAPADRRKGQWTWHNEFELDRDASVPILVHDVDGDGDADVIWGRGHDYGIFWLEQVTKDGARSWRRHTIDRSWSQAHALLLADIDGDGQDDLVAGKRYLGHDGKDPGAYDPLVLYWYDYSQATGRWTPHEIHRGGKIGMDLDPKAADVDGDGDLDLVAPARCGLYWLENLRLQPK